MPSIRNQFQAVSEWCDRNNQPAGFPTCEQEATADPYVFRHRVVILHAQDIQRRNPTASELGFDPSHMPQDPEGWRQRLTTANGYAHAQGFFHGFPDFRQADSLQGERFGTVLIRGTGPGPAGNGVTWQDIPAADIFLADPLEVILGSSYFLYLPPETWMQRLNLWARNHNQAAALPTGWAANYGGNWVVGTVLFEAQAVTVQWVLGTDLEYAQELCGKQAQWAGDPTPSNPVGGDPLVGTAEPAILSVDQAPFGDRLYGEPAKVDYLRCYAQRTGSAVIALFSQDGADGIRMEMRPRADSRTLVYFGNRITTGAWIVAHRFNPDTGETAGEVARFYRLPGGLEEFAFELTTGVAGPGQVSADTVGFVKQGFLGIAHQVMSFAFSTFQRISPGMDFSFTWVLPDH